MDIRNYINSVDLAITEAASEGTPYTSSVAEDTGTRFFLDNLIRTFHYQLDGHVVGRNGNAISNTMDFFEMSEARLLKAMSPYADNPENAVNDEAVQTALPNYKINRTKVEGLRSIFDELKEVYHDTFGTEWVAPEEREAAAEVAEATKAKVSDMMAQLGRVSAA